MSEINGIRKELVYRLFFQSADDDYICARLAARHSLYRHFSWNAGQCLEKYTKALCLLNGKDAKFNHQFLQRLTQLMNTEYEGCFPAWIDIESFTKIRKGFEHFSTERLTDCIKRFETLGNPDLRYKRVNLTLQPYDLQKLDRIVFLLRRLFVLQNGAEQDTHAHRNKLRTDHFYTSVMDWPTLGVSGTTREEKLKALKFENCANFPEKIETSRGWFFSTSEIAPVNLYDLLGHLSEADKIWLQANVK